jgi:hypothetical protein
MPPTTSTLSFTADSPYYAAYISTQQSRLDTLSSSMDKIAKATRAFNDAGRSMAEATHALAGTCRVSDDGAPPDSPDNAFGEGERGKQCSQGGGKNVNCRRRVETG